MKFTGYYAGWNRCEGCGLTLQKVGDNLRHKSGDKSKHDLVLRKKAENKLRESIGLDLSNLSKEVRRKIMR